jgi:hypothetical protein
VDPAPRLVAGSSPLVYDLASTLPDGIRRGGSFSVDASGAPLPVGVTLSAAGMLAASDGLRRRHRWRNGRRGVQVRGAGVTGSRSTPVIRCARRKWRTTDSEAQRVVARRITCHIWRDPELAARACICGVAPITLAAGSPPAGHRGEC